MRAIALAIFVLGGCVSDPTSGKPQGEEGGPCFGNFTCNPGLVCDKGPNVCRKSDASVDDGGGMDTGTADGGTDSGGMDTGTDSGADTGLPCLTNTLAWWSANNNSFNDFFGQFNLTQTGNVTFNQGEVGTAFHFNGGWLMTAGTSPKPGGLAGFTVEFWIRYSSSMIARKVIFFGPSQTPTWQVMISPQVDYLNFDINNIGSTAAQVKMDQNFHHVAFTLTNGQTIRSYVDGIASMTASATGMIPPTSGYLALGADDKGAQPFNGELDEVAIYLRDLSPSEIADTFKAGPTGRCRQ